MAKNDAAKLAYEMIKVIADAKFDDMTDRVPGGREKYNAMPANAQEVLRKTYVLGFTDGYIDMLSQDVKAERADEPRL